MITTVLAAAIACQPFTPAPGQVLQPARSAPAALSAQLQAALDRWAANPGHRGVEAAIILADGSRWEGTAGFAAAGEAMRPDHLITIASITKSMTGAIILQLAGEGCLSLDDSISKWLPAHSEIDRSISLRQLLNHSSGVANYTASPALSAALNADSLHVFTPRELLSFVGPRMFARGERTFYTNTAFLLLGQVAERVTGRPILQLYRERLWGPLGLTEFMLPGHEELKGPVSDVLYGSAVVSPVQYPSLLSIGQSAFGLYSTARTTAAWGHALFTGSVISPALQAEMRKLLPAAGNIPGETGAGLGIRSYGYLGRTQYGHSGGSPMGNSLMLHDPESGVTVAVIMNQRQGSDHFVLVPELLEIAAGKKGR